MILSKFRDTLEQYQEMVGRSTFSSYALEMNPGGLARALEQMKDYLSGRRTAIVTDESIGIKPEGVVEPKSRGNLTKMKSKAKRILGR